MKVNAKGQVTIPVAIRKEMGIIPGVEVEFAQDESRVYFRIINHGGRGKSIVERMTGEGDIKMSTDDIMALTRH